ncbi:MAG: AMP-binding protein [Syntrophobacteraceae bacterium]|jgi:fatty-acyl-CoA synthase
MGTWRPLSEAERARYYTINEDNLEFLMNRYNRVNRRVIADMLRRSRYRFPDKPALIFGNQTLTYSTLEDDCNKVANSLLELGIESALTEWRFWPTTPFTMS